MRRIGESGAALLFAGILAGFLACADGPPDKPPATGLSIVLNDVTREAGLEILQVTGSSTVDYITDSLGCGAAWLDYDGDGDPDLYLAQGATPGRPRQGPPDVLLRNDGLGDDGVPRFTDVTQAAGLGDTLWSFGVAASDYDNDGDTDIFLANWGPDRLYRNDGTGRFTDVAAESGVADSGWGASAAWSDVDRDGDLDLYVARYMEFDLSLYPPRGVPWPSGAPPCTWKGAHVFCGPKGFPPAHDLLYRNDGDPDGDGVSTFTDVTRPMGLISERGYYALAVQFFDADADGDDDLYVANDSVQNTFFVNRGDGRFEEDSIFAGVAYNEQGLEQAGMGVDSADYDGDGRIDLAVTNFSHDHDTLYHNDGDRVFSDASYPSGLGTATFYNLSWGVAFVDLDQDGWEDLLIAHGHVYPQVDAIDVGSSFRQRNGVYRNDGQGRFSKLTQGGGSGMDVVKSSRSVVPIDFDADGDLDVLITNLDDSPTLLRNDGATGNWLQVRLKGTSSNRDGIGATITVTADDRRQVRQVTRIASFAGSSLPIAHFGLGDVDAIERLEVRWPSGEISVVEEIPTDQRIEIVEGES